MTFSFFRTGVLAALVGGIAPPVAADWIAGADAHLLFDDNVGRALTSEDERADFFLGAAATAGQFLALTDRATLVLTADFASDVYARHGGLTQYSLGATAALKQKFGLGAYAPWVSLSGSARHADYQSALRDSWLFSAAVTLGTRFDEHWEAQLEYGFLRRVADRTPAAIEYDELWFPGTVFDQTSHGPKVSATYSWTDETAITASYAYRTGDAFSTGHLTDALADVAEAATHDSAFEAGQVAYRIPADTHSFAVGASRALGAHSSVNLGYQHHWTRGPEELTYHVNRVELSLLYAF
jgi:hypothetical protein